MVGEGRPLLLEILGQTDPIGVIFNRYLLVASQS